MTDLYRARDDYLALRRSLGFKLRGHDRLLTDFIDFVHREAAGTLSTAAALAWATLPAARVQPVRCAHRLCAARGFARYLHALDPSVPVPPTDLLPTRRDRHDPYLYSQEQLTALLTAADQLRPAFRAETYRTFFGLLAVTGLRVSEAIRLQRDEIDLDTGVLVIHQTKFGKHRAVPLHPSTVTALRDYARRRDQLHQAPASASFFISTRGTRLIYQCVHTAFTQMLKVADLPNRPGTSPARIHGLRHSFAMATLHDWYRAGDNVATKLPILSAYLGHAHPASTFWYLSAAPELLALAAERLEHGPDGLGGERR